MSDVTTPQPAADAATSAEAALNARYGTHWNTALPAWNATLDTLLAHRSVRAYANRPLPAGTLETLVAAAQSAATSSNLQTWSVVAVENPARKARLSAFAANQSHVRETPLFLVWLADLSRLERVAAQAGAPLEGVHYLETFLVSAIDTALAAQNAVVAAESLGLSTVYIGAIRNRPEEVAAELGLPPRVMPLFGLCVGYEDETKRAAVKPRLPQQVVLHREQYDAASQQQGIGGYDDVFAAFQTSQGLDDAGWVARSLGRWRSRESLHGRDRLRDALNALGFELR
ncbi:NADPH-dependent oxidoreductase [Paraburkholderia caballeronis]|uniref:NADPH-dependent oxidoreductase n=1 Tax=Paraburkholderia caballeronis TaxID=416943 RepID=UPI0010666E73|nr:NADPH-dependent oxidoreductase [Paraburkholderia caballeronis]TDV19496.1 nitroreductase [Paraburkholderia caballeronis]TDV22096.1 nitroreductase [Paraburkholderia caballeronis]TDV29000.1 nitroreductase [Paraburkholderia caballeronis]